MGVLILGTCRLRRLHVLSRLRDHGQSATAAVTRMSAPCQERSVCCAVMSHCSGWSWHSAMVPAKDIIDSGMAKDQGVAWLSHARHEPGSGRLRATVFGWARGGG